MFKIARGKSALYSAHGQAGDEVLLEEGVCAGNRQNDDNHDSHTSSFLGHIGDQRCCICTNGGDLLGQSGDVGHNAVQQSLQAVEFLVGNVQHGLIPVIPVSKSQEQANGCENRQRDGKYDFKEDGELTCAVDLRGLNQGIRNGLLKRRCGR